VHGPSRLVDHAAFGWSDSGWRGLPLAGSVLYECHVGTFSAAGTFDGAIEHLGHLADLGVDAIELLPVAEFPGRWGWGYDGVDLFAPQHAYGGPDGLKRLVDAAHARGLGVIMDVVYNHLGPDGNYLPEFGPYFSAHHQTNWGDAVNFDGPGSDEVRRFVIDNALMWLRDYHCDGLRLDAVHAIADDSATHILEALAVEVDALAAHARRPLFLIAESDRNDPRLVRSRDAGGYGLGASWADEWHHALHAVLTGENSGYYADFGPLRLLAKALRQAWVYDGAYSPYRQRVHGRPVTGAGRQPVRGLHPEPRPDRQPGGRGAHRGADQRRAAPGRRRAAAHLAVRADALPGRGVGGQHAVPVLHRPRRCRARPGRQPGAPRRVRRVRLGSRRRTRSAGSGDFRALQARLGRGRPGRHASLLAWYRRLLALRRQLPALTDPRLDRVETEYDEKAGWLVIRRGPVAVASNLGRGTWTFPAAASAELLAASDARVRRAAHGVVLPPDTVVVIQTNTVPAMTNAQPP
jgi:maltooligosyltrehalose trehalohydrolase